MKSVLPLVLFGGFLFLVLPFAYIEITQDPELTLRHLLISAFLAIFAILLWISRKSFPLQIQPDPITISFAVYLTFSLLAVTRSINIGDAVYEVGKTGIWLIVLIFLTALLKRTDKYKAVLPSIITLCALIFLLIGIYQLINFTQGESPSNNSGQITSFLSNKNFFGEILLLMLPFSLYLVFSYTAVFRWFSVASILLSFSFIFYIMSFTVFIAAFFTFSTMLILTFIFRKKLFNSNLKMKRLTVISLCVIAIISIPLTLLITGKINNRSLSSKVEAVKFYIQHPDQIYSSTSGNNDNSVYDRIFLAKNSLQLFQENPIAGIGIANWKIMMPKYGMYGNNIMSIGRIRFEHPHNDYLFILCETGITGLIFWIALFGFGFFFAFRTLINSKDKNTTRMMICLIGVLISFAIISLFSYPKERVFSMLLLVTALALIIVNISDPIKKIVVPSTYFLFTAVILSLCVLYINFQRYRSEVSLYAAFHFQKKELFTQMQHFTEAALSPFHILDQSGTPLRWHLGQAFYYQNNIPKAFENYLIASKQNPYHMQVLNDLGALYESKGDHVNATNCFNRVFAINPNFPDSKFNMAAVYFNSGDTARAYTLLKNINTRYSIKWQTAMQTILFAKTEKLVQNSKDTALVEFVNNKLKIDPKYLLLQYFEAEKEGIPFEVQLQSNKLTK